MKLNIDENILFSIIIPSFKSRFLKEAIESVLSQTYSYWELIIVNDQSPEDLLNIVKPYLTDIRIHYITNSFNYGAHRLSENWNNCLKHCHGQYVICMGDDDMLTPNSLAEYRKYINKFINVDVIHGQTEVINENGEVIELLEPRFEFETPLQLIYYRWFGLGRQQFIGDFCYKKESLLNNGGFYNLPLAWGSDDITAVIAATKAGIVNTTNTCFLYRKNALSISSDANHILKAKTLLLQKNWYIKYFAEYTPINNKEKVLLEILKMMLPKHFDFHICNLIKENLRYKKTNIFFWLKHRRNFSITTLNIFIQLLKSLR